MTEKKLSGEELIMNLDKMIEDYKNEIGWCDVWEKTTTQLKSLIESPDKYTPAILDELHEVRMKNVELKEQIETYKYPGSHKNKETEPSEAELEEFVEKWADIVTPVVLINNEMRPQLMKAMQKDLINMLKEYDKLRRG